jgi:TonB-dependent SusC/RagA subfamily outer membrane receptor
MLVLARGPATLFAAAILALGVPAAAQTPATPAPPTGTVRGVVRAVGGAAPIPNAQLSIVGTRVGAVSREDGSYVIVGAPTGAQRVQVRLIGSARTEQPVQVPAGGSATVAFALAQCVATLDQVVITGTAGQARQREVGNSISQVNLANAPEPTTNVSNLLQGRVAGASVQLSGGSAGAGSSIRLRGNSSVALSNQPLIYVDGVRMRSDEYPKNSPNPQAALRSGNVNASPLNDINPEDIERVEIIKGAAATTLYGTDASAGVVQIFTKKGQAGKAQWNLQTNQGFNRLRPFSPDDGGECSDTQACSKYLYINPWLRDGYRQSYLGSVSGGQASGGLRYFVSANYDQNKGVLPKDAETKINVRGNFGFQPTSKLTFDITSSFTSDSISNTPAGNNAAGLTLNAFRRDRNYFGNANIDTVSQILSYDLTTGINHLVLGGRVNYAITPTFTHRLTFGLDRSEVENRNLRPFGFVSQPTGALSDQSWRGQLLTAEYVGNYERDLFGLRSTSGWGAQSQTSDTRDLQAYTEGFPGPGVPVVSSGSQWQGIESRIRVITAGVFLQQMFGWRDRLFVTAGLRVDGNSAFGSNLGLQSYPKLSTSYVLSDEAFWPKAVGTLKLRAAYGEAGRAPGAFDALRTYSAVGWGGQPAFRTNTVGNPDLGPERSRETELGFDASTFGGRLNADFTYFRTITNDALLPVQQIPSLGFLANTLTSRSLENVGKLQKQGIELALNGDVVRSDAFTWTLGSTIALNSSKVLDLGGAPEFLLTNYGWIIEGQPVAVLRGRKVLNEDEIADPVVDPAYLFGPSQPTRIIGLTSSFRLPLGFELSARGEYQGGHYINEDASFQALSRAVEWPTCFASYAKEAAQRTAWERSFCTAANARQDQFIFKGDFFKLRDITLRAPIPARLVPGATSAGFSLSVQNWYTWKNDDFRILDPEMSGNDGFNAAVRYISEHIPAPATVIAQLRVGF